MDSRFSRATAGASKDDKSGTSKSATAKGKEAAGSYSKVGGGPEENKDEKLVEEDGERRFDGSGYDKDLVEMLGKFKKKPTGSVLSLL